jgi:hypothetical protein
MSRKSFHRVVFCSLVIFMSYVTYSLFGSYGLSGFLGGFLVGSAVMVAKNLDVI